MLDSVDVMFSWRVSFRVMMVDFISTERSLMLLAIPLSMSLLTTHYMTRQFGECQKHFQ